MEIGNVKLKSKFTLAPMAGFTDVGFRSLCAKFGAGLTTTEMVSLKGLLYNNADTKNLLVFENNEQPKSVQIFLREPELVKQVFEKEFLQPFDIIDINMGCPVPKIVKEGMGSALMKEPDVAKKVIEAVVKHSKKPVTVKFRSGFDFNNINAVDFAKMCEDSGASAVCVHGRTREQMYSGKADWNIIAEVVKAVSIPVLGNGDVTNKIEADKMINETGCSGVAIGRGALGKPWIFSELNGNDINVNIVDVIKEHYKILCKYENHKIVLLNMRKHLASYISNVRGAKQLRQQLTTSNDINEIFFLLEKVFTN